MLIYAIGVVLNMDYGLGWKFCESKKILEMV